jgi:hypothetical protein
MKKVTTRRLILLTRVATTAAQAVSMCNHCGSTSPVEVAEVPATYVLS